MIWNSSCLHLIHTHPPPHSMSALWPYVGSAAGVCVYVVERRGASAGDAGPASLVMCVTRTRDAGTPIHDGNSRLSS